MSLATTSTPPDVSVLVPAKDEAENLPEFVRLAREALLPLSYACELVIVDDGSHDGTPLVLAELAAKHPFVRVVTRSAGSPTRSSRARMPRAAACSCSIPPTCSTSPRTFPASWPRSWRVGPTS
jgi:cellulose synthase/poly-beta-1,6-N-acetylglucosamine synthase-like glycosyltransferase